MTPFFRAPQDAARAAVLQLLEGGAEYGHVLFAVHLVGDRGLWSNPRSINASRGEAVGARPGAAVKEANSSGPDPSLRADARPGRRVRPRSWRPGGRPGRRAEIRRCSRISSVSHSGGPSTAAVAAVAVCVRAGGFSFGGVSVPGGDGQKQFPGTRHVSGCRECDAGSVLGVPVATTGPARLPGPGPLPRPHYGRRAAARRLGPRWRTRRLGGVREVGVGTEAELGVDNYLFGRPWGRRLRSPRPPSPWEMPTTVTLTTAFRWAGFAALCLARKG